MFDIYFWSVIAFFAVVAVVLYRNRGKVESKYYVFYMYRTKRFRDFIDSVARIGPRGWKFVYSLAIVVCIIVMAFGAYSILSNDYNILAKSGKISQAALILPTPSSEGSAGPGYILIPFWFWIIVIGCILIPHEFSHGIIARAEKIPLKSVGLMLFAIFPGAFVEPDEKAIGRSSTLTKLRIFAAGSFANFVVAALVLVAMAYAIWPAVAAPAVSMQLTEVNESSPAMRAGLEPGMVITAINGKTITTNYFEYLFTGTYIADEMGKVMPNDTINVTTSNGNTYAVTLAENPETRAPYMGVIFNYSEVFAHRAFLVTFEPLMRMIWMFSFFVGMFNVLPLYPLDGGLMMQAVSQRFAGKGSKRIVSAVSMIMLLSIILSFIGPSIFA